VPGAFFREGRRLFLRAMHLLSSRTLFFAGILLSITTAFATAQTLWFSLAGKVAEGRVVREVEELAADWTSPASVLSRPGVQTARAARVYRAIVQFQIKDPADAAVAGNAGRVFEVSAQLRSTARLYPVGTKVDVVYPPGKPGRAKLRPELPDFWSQAGLLLMATVVGAGTAYGWWKSAKKRVVRRRRVVSGAS
jgi:hypothetical protein